MLNILPISDIHLEGSNFKPKIPDTDVIILAGDVGLNCYGIKWAKSLDARVLYVPGNHEFEGFDYDQMLSKLKEEADKTDNVTLMSQDEVVIDGVRFLGCTMWTDFKLFGDAWYQKAKLCALQGMPDYSTIFKNKRLLHVADTEKMHHSDRQWLKMKLRTPFQGETVVITHHAPHFNSVVERYRKNLISAAFASNLDELLGRSLMWVHGHTHASLEYFVDDTLVICNARGFHREMNRELTGFDINKVIGIDNVSYGPNP